MGKVISKDPICREVVRNVYKCVAFDGESIAVPANDYVDLETDFKHVCKEFLIEIYSSSYFTYEVYTWSGSRWIRLRPFTDVCTPGESIDENGNTVYYTRQYITETIGKLKIRVKNMQNTDISIDVTILCKT